MGAMISRPAMGQMTTAPAATPPRPSAFSQIFKTTTNENGYEEWVQAADLIQDNQDVEAALEQLFGTVTISTAPVAPPAGIGRA